MVGKNAGKWGKRWKSQGIFFSPEKWELENNNSKSTQPECLSAVLPIILPILSDCRGKEDYDESHVITSKKAPKVTYSVQISIWIYSST